MTSPTAPTNPTATVVEGVANEALSPPPNGPSVLLMGEMSSGKTTALRSLVELGLEVFYVPLEPGFEELVGDLPKEKLKWHYIPAYGGTIRDEPNPGHSFDTLYDQAKLINSTSHDTIQKMGGVRKENHQQFLDVIMTCNNFKDDRTGEEFGDVSTWENNRVLFIDGLSGLSNMAIRNCIGDKPFMELRDYSAVQFQLEQLINALCSRTKSWFVLTSHLERETDPNTGAYKLMVSVPGKALAPKLPRFFSDSILCKQTVTQGKSSWNWSTLSNEVTVKTRNLPLADNLAPNFKLLFENWKKRTGA
jgi:hypothetical protein